MHPPQGICFPIRGPDAWAPLFRGPGAGTVSTRLRVKRGLRSHAGCVFTCSHGVKGCIRSCLGYVGRSCRGLPPAWSPGTQLSRERHWCDMLGPSRVEREDALGSSVWGTSVSLWDSHWGLPGRKPQAPNGATYVKRLVSANQDLLPNRTAASAPLGL